MKKDTTAAFGARRAARRATCGRWLLLSLVVAGLVLTVFAPGVASAADSKSEQQLDFGADMAKRGLWKEALFRFMQADRHDPDNPRILNNIAVSYEALGLFDEALDYYQKALRAGPDEKELRGNYSRFAEFYQSFRPQEEVAGQPETAKDEAVEGPDESEETGE